MKIDKSIILSFVMLVLIASLYRIMPGRPLGFAPQIAMALFSGSIIRDKKFSFLLPLGSMLLSDLLFEVLFYCNITPYGGFYEGQFINYIFFMAITVIGFAIHQSKWQSILAGSVGGVVFYFLASNFSVWIGGGLSLSGLPYAKTMAGFTECMLAGLPFLKGSFYATLFFGAVLFGGHHLFNTYLHKKTAVA
jgi:hypothetical protein